jgi:hypothetical protein
VQPDEHDPRGAGILASQPRRVYQTAQGLADQQSPLARHLAGIQEGTSLASSGLIAFWAEIRAGWAGLGKGALFVHTSKMERDGVIGKNIIFVLQSVACIANMPTGASGMLTLRDKEISKKIRKSPDQIAPPTPLLCFSILLVCPEGDGFNA